MILHQTPDFSRRGNSLTVTAKFNNGKLPQSFTFDVVRILADNGNQNLVDRREVKVEDYPRLLRYTLSHYRISPDRCRLIVVDDGRRSDETLATPSNPILWTLR